ncbi:endonuclease domain-containing protein [Microbacterium arborescens]|uniref:endonuclease domain-containing protein n=1 Tax=Microbacterium arborescens TaxID=33883 RepID=UPI0025A2782F|nr:hypothetical protein [Microbacterium arborescens]WJM15071.1 hypothetical protein QUC20_12400 [Microbacterium arborescens]
MDLRASSAWPAADVMDLRCWSTSELRADGMRKRDIADAVATGRLVRPRRGSYLVADAPRSVVTAVSLGGRLTCVSLLRLLGVFVLEPGQPHVQLPPTASRLPLRTAGTDAKPVLHWTPPAAPRPRWFACSSIIDALARAVMCQPPRAAVATLDSALQLGLLHAADLDAVFAALPLRYRSLRRLIDGRAESGPETLMRLLLRGVAKTVELQVRIPGVGRIDLLVDGWLIVECDSDAHHSGLDARRRDSTRDLAAAALGYLTLRPMAADIMWRPDRVLEAVRGLLGRGAPRARVR